MKQKLWKVTVKHEFVVAAKDEDAAVQNTIRDKLVTSAKEEPTFAADEILGAEDLPDGYDETCIPWGDDTEEATIGEILSEGGQR